MNSFSLLLWKEYREIRWIILFAITSVLFVASTFLFLFYVQTNGSPSNFYFTSLVNVLGGLFAIQFAIAVTSGDMGPRILLFLRSRSIPLSYWLLAKIGIGLLGLSFITLLPMLCEGILLNFFQKWNSQQIKYMHFALFNLIHISFLYTLILSLIVWTRETVISAIVGFMVMVTFYLAPHYITWLFPINTTLVSNQSVWMLNPPLVQQLFTNFSFRTLAIVPEWLLQVVYLNPVFFVFYGVAIAGCFGLSLWAVRFDKRLPLHYSTLSWATGGSILAAFLCASLLMQINIDATALPLPTGDLGTVTHCMQTGNRGMLQYVEDKDAVSDTLSFVPFLIQEDGIETKTPIQTTCTNAYAKSALPYAWNADTNLIYTLYEHEPEGDSEFWRDQLDLVTLALDGSNEGILHRLNLIDTYPEYKKWYLPKLLQLKETIFLLRSGNEDSIKVPVISIANPKEPQLLDPIEIPNVVKTWFPQEKERDMRVELKLPSIPSLTPEERLRISTTLLQGSYFYKDGWFVSQPPKQGNLPMMKVYKVEGMDDEKVTVSLFCQYTFPPLEFFFQAGSIKDIDIFDSRLYVLQAQSYGNNVMNVFDIQDSGEAKLLYRFTSKEDSPSKLLRLPSSQLLLLGKKVQRLSFSESG